jgi:hypothetical protein
MSDDSNAMVETAGRAELGADMIRAGCDQRDMLGDCEADE